MKDVYMSIELGQLKSILDSAIELQKGKIKTPRTLEGLINEYNRISSSESLPNELPLIPSFDSENDIALLDGNLTGSGLSKLTNLITHSDGYIKAHTPIPPTVIEGWNKGHVITIVGIIIATVIGLAAIACVISYNQGANSKEKVLYDERDSLKQANIEFQKNITNLNDSVTNLNNYLDTLRNIASIKKTLNDSLNKLSAKSKAFEDNLKKSNQKIDSLKHENQRISDTYTGMWSLFQQAEKSLKKCQKQCMKN